MTQVANMLRQAQTLSLASTSVENTISQLKAHSLLEQDRASLMTRVDDKYIIKQSDLNQFFEYTKKDFTVLQDHQLRIFPYQTIYYDTDEYKFYHQHHSGKANRLKIRTREYLHTGSTFLEIKKKNNKGITHKYRHQLIGENNLFYCESLIAKLGIEENVYPALQVNYQRITLVHKSKNQRITIDLNLKFRDTRNNQFLDTENIAIIEIKRDRSDHQLRQSNVHIFLKSIGYQPVNFSKYCMGCVLSNVKNIKKNRFKNILLFLKHHFSIEVANASF